MILSPYSSRPNLPAGARSSAGASILRRIARQLAARTRALPDFIIVGAMKAGTSSLHRYLSQHPKLHPASPKELHFFDDDRQFAKGLTYYRSNFHRLTERHRGCMAFEASPRYLFDPRAPARIRSMCPRTKIIILLREPVARTVSHYLHQVRMGRETLPFADAIWAEDERLRCGIQTSNFEDPSFIHFSYRARSRYVEQLLRYWRLFERDRIFVAPSEDLFRTPREFTLQVLDFLKVGKSGFQFDATPQNVGVPSNDIDGITLRGLAHYFAPFNQALFSLLGRDYRWTPAARP